MKLTKDVVRCGTCLATYLTDEQQKKVETMNPTAFLPDPFKGYDGDEWTFADEDGTGFCCYRRYGNMRVAALPEDHAKVGRFLAWLDSLPNDTTLSGE